MAPVLPCIGVGRQQWSILAAGVAVLLPLRGSTLSAAPLVPQRDQLERGHIPELANPDARAERRAAPVIPEAATDDDAFGAQLILKERLRKKELQASAEIGAYHTSNVALARSGALGDAFLNTTLGLSWRHDFTDRLTLAISARYGLFRYSRYSVLDFQSTETDVTFGYKLGANWELGLGYAYTQLNARTDNTEFYCEHAVNVGLQRVFEVDDRNAIIAGIGSSWTWADPEAAQRDKYAAFLGWRWRATERISTTLLYRYARYEYRDGGTGRGDHNQTLSLSVRYDATDWLALTASGFSTWNRSNQTAFDYEAWNLGGNIGVNARF